LTLHPTTSPRSPARPDEILEDFPDLTEQDIRATLKFAAEREHVGRIGSETPGDRPAGE
jgi:hypothetical protein